MPLQGTQQGIMSTYQLTAHNHSGVGQGGVVSHLVLTNRPKFDVRNYATFALAVADIGATETTLFIPTVCAVAGNVAVPATLTLEIQQGGGLNIDNGRVVTINGQINAGVYQIFEGLGTVIFTTIEKVYPDWWDGADYGIQINAAIASIAALYGGRVVFTHDADIETSINATDIRGIIFEGTGSGTAAAHGVVLTGVLNGVLFDCVKSQGLTFKNFSIAGDSVTVPTVGFLMARDNSAESAGDHTFYNVRSDGMSYFSDSVIYSFASEHNYYYDCIFYNRVAGAKVFVSTYSNILGVASIYQTIDPVVNSNSCTFIYGGQWVNFGGANSDVFYFDGASDFHVYGGLWYCHAAAANGRAYVYVDTTNTDSSVISFDGIRGEPGGFRPEYSFYFGDTAITISNWTISNCRFQSNTNVLFAHDNVIISQLNWFNVYEDVSGISIRTIQLSYIVTNGLAVTVRNILHLSTIWGDRGAVTVLGAISDSWIFYMDFPVIWGSSTELTIAGGAITITGRFHRVDGQGDANDDLDTINGGEDGMELTLTAENVLRTITLRDNIGNIQLEGNVNMQLANILDKIYLFYDAAQGAWVEKSRFTG